MRLVEVARPCPVCGVAGWYTEMSLYRGPGRGVPGMQWVMRECGHSLSTPQWSRSGEGWVRVDPESRDAPYCE